MRIAFVSQEYPPESAKGGIGSQTFLKAHGMAALGHQVNVISRSAMPERSEREDHGVIVTRIPDIGARMPVYTEIADWLTYSAEVAAELTSLHAKTPVDVVDFPEWGSEGYLYLLNRTEWNYIPTAIHLHGPLVMFAHTMAWPELDSEFYRVGTEMEGTCLRLADATFSSSRCAAEWCEKHYGLNRSRTPVIHTGVDTQLFSPRETAKSDAPAIVFTGKIARNKGVHLLVEAASRLVQEFPGLRLTLIGRGEHQVVDELRSLAISAGAPDLLDMPGFVDRHDLPDWLSSADVFAAPSQYEGGPGFVYLEAMACGLPVIACEGSGAAEVVTHGLNGLLVPPEDADALTAALRSLLGDPSLRRKMGERARNFTVEKADSRTCIGNLESFYRSVAAGSARNGSEP